MQELYGDATAAQFTSGLSRLFTAFLQLHGFSCGLDDLLLQVRSLNLPKLSQGSGGLTLLLLLLLLQQHF